MPKRRLSLDEVNELEASTQGDAKPGKKRLSIADVTAAQSAPSSGISPEQSALYGAGQGLTFGYSDELLGGAKALKDKFTDGGDYSDLYRKRVDQERRDLDEAEKTNPKSYFGGNIAGSLPTMAIPGLGIARGAKLGATLGKAALQGALMASGESTSNPFGSGQEATQFARDVGVGGVTGAATQGLFSGVGNMLGKLSPSALKQTAAERAVKATTGQNISALRKMTGSTHNSAGDIKKIEAGLRKTGSDIMEEGALGPLDRVEDLAPKLSEARQKYGSLIGSVGKEIDAAQPQAVDARKIANDLVDYASTIPPTEGGKRIQEKILSEASNFDKMGRMSFEDAQGFKNQFKYKPQDADALISNQDATNKIRRIIGAEMENTADNLSNTGAEGTKELLKKYRELKSKYGSFKGASDAASDRVQKNLSIRYPSPSDYGVGIATALGSVASSKPGDDDSYMKYLMYGALGGMANKFARQRGSALAATAAQKIASVMEKAPTFAKEFGRLIIDAANRGPAALVTTHAMMMKRPEYKNYFEGNQE